MSNNSIDVLQTIVKEADREVRKIGASARRGDQSIADTFRFIRDSANGVIEKNQEYVRVEEYNAIRDALKEALGVVTVQYNAFLASESGSGPYSYVLGNIYNKIAALYDKYRV